MIFRIAKSELRTIFYSPIAWFLLIAFLVQCALTYFNVIFPYVKTQEVAVEINPSFTDWDMYPLTALILLSPNGPIMMVLSNLYLFIPLLTMGLISREFNEKTIKLIFSSPVKIRHLVLGKYLAILVYNVLLVCIVGIVFGMAKFDIKDWDYGLLLSACLAFFLLASAYTAIGLFMSSLTNYQILSALGIFVTIFGLSRIGNVWQHIDVIRDLTYFFHMLGHLGRMLKGLILSSDVIYFIMVICLFLGLTLIRLRSLRETKPWYIILMRCTVVLGTVLLLGYVSSRPQFILYADLLTNKKNTIVERTQKIIEDMGDAPLEVTLYTNLLGPEAEYGLPQARNAYLTTLWDGYLRFKPDIQFKYLYYYYYDSSLDNGGWRATFPEKDNEAMAQEVAKGFKVNPAIFDPPEAIRKHIDLNPEGHRLVMQLKFKGRTEFLRTYGPPEPYPEGTEYVWPHEQNVLPALKRLVYPEKIPKILFSIGNLERNIYDKGQRGYFNATINKARFSALINMGFDVDTINLDAQDIPEGTTVLVIADPKTALSEVSMKKLIDYIDGGGNMIVNGEPGKQHLLNPLLKHMGVAMLDGILIEPSADEMPQMVKANFTRESAFLSEEFLMFRLRKDLENKHPHDTIRLLMPGAAALSFADSNGFVKAPLLLTPENKTWIKKGALVTDSAEVVYNPAEGDVKGVFPTGLKVTRKLRDKEQRIAIFSDADFLNNERYGKGEPLNKSIYYWMTNEEFPAYPTRPQNPDNLLLATTKSVKKASIIYIWVLPAILLALGTLILIRRQRK